MANASPLAAHARRFITLSSTDSVPDCARLAANHSGSDPSRSLVIPEQQKKLLTAFPIEKVTGSPVSVA
jgi:hypothetical protein